MCRFILFQRTRLIDYILDYTTFCGLKEKDIFASSSRNFIKRLGTTDKGKDYEDLTVASLALQLLTDKKIKNFKISSNDENFGAFDDVVLEIESEENTEEKYALQLKHVHKGKPLALKALAEENGNYSIRKYFKSFQKFKKNAAGYKLVLITNLEFDISGGEQIQLVGSDNFQVEIVKCEAKPLLNTSNEVKHCYKFRMVGNTDSAILKELEEYKYFFDCMFLYTNQENVDKLKINTVKKLQKIFCCKDSVAESYFHFISAWSLREGTKEKLDKGMMKKVMALHVLAPYIHPISFGGVGDKIKLLQEAISTFDITLFDLGSLESVEKIWGDAKKDLNDMKEINVLRKKYQICENNIQDINRLSGEECSKLLWLMGKCPLIVTKSQATSKIVDLCSDGKFVVLGANSAQEFKAYSVFRKLSDLKNLAIFKDIASKFVCSLQEKKESTLEELLEENAKIEDLITTDELLEMANHPLLIGEGKETLPTPYITRLVSKNVISANYLEKLDRNTLIFISNFGRNDTLGDNFNVVQIRKQFDEEINRNQDTIIYVSEEDDTEEMFDKLCEENQKLQKFHHFRMLEDGNLDWIRSKNGISDLQKYHIKTYFLEETELSSELPQNNINLLSGEPGMGKSMLVKNLKNNLPSVFWTVIFSPQDISDFTSNLQKTCCIEEEFSKFVVNTKYAHLKSFDKEYLKLCMQNGQIIYLWDALDEITEDSLNKITNLICRLSGTCFMQWVTCRHYLKETLEKKFGVLSRTMSPFDEHQQIAFIKKRLESYSDDNIEEKIEKIKISSVASLDLSIPIQIFMLTELFSKNPEKYSNLLKRSFAETDLYRHFIDEKFSVYHRDKANVSAPNRVLKQVLELEKKTRIENYEKAALQSLIHTKFLKKWGINCEDFLSEIRKENDRFGFIKEIRHKESVFVHKSYAEYFVATYFVKHCKKLWELKKIIFDRQYLNVQYFFDLLLAKDNSAHIAVLHRNFDALRKCGAQLHLKDLGGRSVLHLACSWGERYQTLNLTKRFRSYIIEDQFFDDSSIKAENPEYIQMLEYLVGKCELSYKDDLFKLNPLSYAMKSNCLWAVATLMRQKKTSSDCCIPTSFLSTPVDRFICTILFCAVKCGDGTLLNLFEDEDIKFIVTGSDGRSFLHLLVLKNNLTCVQRLLFVEEYRKNINWKDHCGITAMFLASFFGFEDMVHLLHQYGADVNIVDRGKKTPLHAAAENGHYQIVVALVNYGANFDVVDEENTTPLGLAAQNGHTKIVQYLNLLLINK